MNQTNEQQASEDARPDVACSAGLGRGDGFARHLRRHDLTPGDVVPSSAPGYWQVRQPCPGGSGCRHGFRGALGPCGGGTRLSIYYAEPGRDERGRFLRPHREWERQRARAA